MTDDLKDLKRAYRDIEAPPYIATRIRAEVADATVRQRRWMPAVATVTVVVAAVLLLPFLQQQTAIDASATKPSLSALAALKPAKPEGKSPSLSAVRTVKVPAPPRRPQLRPAKPQTRSLFEFELMEEKDHAHS